MPPLEPYLKKKPLTLIGGGKRKLSSRVKQDGLRNPNVRIKKESPPPKTVTNNQENKVDVEPVSEDRWIPCIMLNTRVDADFEGLVHGSIVEQVKQIEEFIN